jgi:tetratricopeptide (TPR) repeat protein
MRGTVHMSMLSRSAPVLQLSDRSFDHSCTALEKGNRMQTVKKSFLVFVGLLVASAGATPVKIEGTLLNRTGKPIVKAQVSLSQAKLTGTSDEDGVFGIFGDVAVKNEVSKPAKAVSQAIVGNRLVFETTAHERSARIAVYDVRGHQVTISKLDNLSPGSHSIDPFGAVPHAPGYYIITVKIGMETTVLRTVATARSLSSYNMPSAPVFAAAGKTLASAVDTLVVVATGYRTARLPLTSYQWKVTSLAMDTGAVIRISISSVPSESAFVAFALTYKKKYYDLLNIVDEKPAVDVQLQLLAVSDTAQLRRNANKVSTIACALASGNLSEYITLCFAAAAAAAAPRDPVVVNNFGAFLRNIDETEASVYALTYAKSLRPDAPLILVNLGNSLLELSDDSTSEVQYRAALKTNANYGPAHEGLAVICYKQRNFFEALDHMVRAISYNYAPSIQGLYSEAVSTAKVPPPAPINDPGNTTAGTGDTPPDQSSIAAPEQLFIPPFPNWPDALSFCAAQKSLKEFSDQTFGVSLAMLDEALKLPDQIKALSPSEQEAMGRQAVRYHNVLFALGCLGEYFSDRRQELAKDNQRKLEALAKKYENSLNQISSACTQKLHRTRPPQMLFRPIRMP